MFDSFFKSEFTIYSVLLRLEVVDGTVCQAQRHHSHFYHVWKNRQTWCVNSKIVLTFGISKLNSYLCCIYIYILKVSKEKNSSVQEALQTHGRNLMILRKNQTQSKKNKLGLRGFLDNIHTLAVSDMLMLLASERNFFQTKGNTGQFRGE